MPGFYKAPFLGLTFFCYTNKRPNDVVCNIATYYDNTIPYSKCDQASGLQQQLQLASEPESDLRDTPDLSNNSDAIDVKMDRSVLEEKSSFKMLGLFFLLNWIGAHTQSLFEKLPPSELEL